MATTMKTSGLSCTAHWVSVEYRSHLHCT